MSEATIKRFAQVSIKTDKKELKTKVYTIIEKVLVYLLMAILTFLCIFPFYVMIINSTRNSSEIATGMSWWFSSSLAENWEKVFVTLEANYPMVRAMGNSLLISVCSSLLTVYFSAMTAYAFHQYNFAGKKFLYSFILVIMMIPSQVSAVGFINLCNRLNLMNTYWPLIIPSIASPVVVFYMKQYLDSVLPNEIVEAARVDGAGEIRIFHQIVLPVLKPALAVQMIFAFVGSWNNLFMPQMIISKRNLLTLPLVIQSLSNLSNNDAFKLGTGGMYLMMTVAVVPLLIIYLIFSRFIVKGVTLGSVKG